MAYNHVMKDLRDQLSGYMDRLKTREPGDFPSYEHEVAWILAEYFQEPYGLWVRNVMYSKLNAGQIKYEFEQLLSRPFTRRQKAKMLTSTMSVRVNR